MSPIQQMLLGAGVVTKKTYIDDVFSTYLWEGTGSARSINNGIDTSGEGSLVWVKKRNDSGYHTLYDTDRGVHKPLYSNLANSEANFNTTLTAFNNNGFSIGDSAFVNASNITYTSWTFRKAPGFFTICEWTGNATNRLISHDLGCVPGLILIKRTDVSADWMVYHRSLNGGVDPGNYRLHLNTEVAENTASTVFNNTEPTSTTFSIGSHYDVNGNNGTFVAYVFAGGKGTTDKAVDFDGSGDYLSLPSTTDLNLTGDFTIEFWVYPRSQSTSRQTILQTNRSWGAKYAVLQIQNDTQSGIDKKAQLWDYDMNNGMPIIYSNTDIEEDEWTHIAFTRESGTIKIYINGKLDKTETGLSDSIEFGDTSSFIGNHSNSYYLNAKLSNLRIVNGQAIYKTTFNVPHDPLTTTSQNAVATNVKLLCCNGATATASTVTPVTITANGDPTVTTNNSVFDDTAAHVFGESGSESVIKCGSYVGDTQTDGPDVYLGWEPMYLLIKNAETANTPWQVWDSMRGVVTGGNDEYLSPNNSDSTASYERISFTPTGFKLDANSSYVNESGKRLIYVAIRRADGYVGKLPELGTDVLSIGTRSGSSSNALACVNTLVDFSLIKNYGAGEYWAANARLMGNYSLKADTNNSQLQGALPTSGGVWDRMLGHLVAGGNGATNSPTGNMVDYGWKRYAGFDVVAYTGNGVSGRQIRHSMNKTVEMLWIKTRDSTEHWIVGHKGLDGGSDPWDHEISLSDSGGEANNVNKWNDTAPTSTHFTLGNGDAVNKDGDKYIALLFASVNGISKVGYYDGSNSSQTITTGFQPRFVIIKCTTDSNDWYVLDTTRGWGSGVDKNLRLNSSVAQNSDDDFGAPTSTGFTLTGNMGQVNVSGEKFIYYAHA